MFCGKNIVREGSASPQFSFNFTKRFVYIGDYNAKVRTSFYKISMQLYDFHDFKLTIVNNYLKDKKTVFDSLDAATKEKLQGYEFMSVVK